jgi:hypothetical protein
VCLSILVISTRCQRAVHLPIKELMTNWPHYSIQRIRILGLASFMRTWWRATFGDFSCRASPQNIPGLEGVAEKVSHSLIFLASNFKLSHTFLVPMTAQSCHQCGHFCGFDFLPIFKVERRQPMQLWRKRNSLEDGRTMQAPSTYLHVRSSLRPK